MVINQILQAYAGVYEITPDNGPAFFLRKEYLSSVDSDRIAAKEEFSDEETLDIMNAALVCSAEFAAMTYLARAEHCRGGLEQKLLRKGIGRAAIKAALDYLEENGLLDDERYAGAWLRTRAINHAEGRIRLMAELSKRGVARDAAKRALDEFFSERSQQEICELAYRKLRRVQGDSEKIRASLLQKGFTMKEIESAMSSNI